MKGASTRTAAATPGGDEGCCSTTGGEKADFCAALYGDGEEIEVAEDDTTSNGTELSEPSSLGEDEKMRSILVRMGKEYFGKYCESSKKRRSRSAREDGSDGRPEFGGSRCSSSGYNDDCERKALEERVARLEMLSTPISARNKTPHSQYSYVSPPSAASPSRPPPPSASEISELSSIFSTWMVSLII